MQSSSDIISHLSPSYNVTASSSEIMDVANSLAHLLPASFDAKSAITQMAQKNFPHARQTEWIGWYVEYLIAQQAELSAFARCRRIYDHGSFDLRIDNYDCDVKTHVISSTAKKNKFIILNDKQTMDESLALHGCIYLLIVSGTAGFDDDGSLRTWRHEFFGGPSAYSQRNSASGRRSRKLKTLFAPTKVSVVEINENNVSSLMLMHQGRNSNGNSRAVKYKMPVSMLVGKP